MSETIEDVEKLEIIGGTLGNLTRVTATPDEFIRRFNSYDTMREALQGLMWRFEVDDSDPLSASDMLVPDITAARAALAAAEAE